MGRPKIAARAWRARSRAWSAEFANLEWRRAQLPRTLGGGWEHSAPLVLAVFLEARIERSTVENSRRRQRTFYPLVSSKARKRNGLSGWLSRTLDRGRECSTPWSRRRLGCSRKRSRLLAGERSEVKFLLKRLPFYIATRMFGDFRRFSVLFDINFPHAVRMLRSGGFGERDVDRRRSGIFERSRDLIKSWQKICWAHRAVTSRGQDVFLADG